MKRRLLARLQLSIGGLGFWILVIWFGVGCGTAEEVPAVLARAGDVTVSPEEFRINYEFGYGHLRRAERPKEAILRYLLAEKAIANEARGQNLDTLASIRASRRSMQEELTIERVFTERVLNGIAVSDEEIRTEINRDAVRFQFRFVPAPDSLSALQVEAVFSEEGFEAAAALSVGQDAESMMSEWTSPLVSAGDIDPLTLAVIQDLEILTPSRPVRMGGLWYIFEVVDIRRTPLAEEDYQARAPSVQKVIWNRKAMEEAARFVADTMEPLEVTTRRNTLYALAQVLFDWYAEATPTRNLLDELASADRSPTNKDALRSLLEDELVTFDGRTWDVQAFLEAFTPSRYVIRARDPAAFTLRLTDIIGLVVRDFVFLEMADSEDWDEHPEDRIALQRWEDKWLFHALRDQTLDLEAVDWSRIAALSDSLLSSQEVFIDHVMLDTMSLAVSETNPFMTIHLMKSHSNRMPFPVVDPNWNESHIRP